MLRIQGRNQLNKSYKLKKIITENIVALACIMYGQYYESPASTSSL